MVSSTSFTISGSSAEVGSSNSMSLGLMQSARAIATRCCWPPDSWPGYLCACSGIFTRSRYFMAISSASRLGIWRTQIGASVQFSSTVRCGNRLKCWNTMPTSRRISSIFFRSSTSSMPSTRMRALLVALQPVDAADHGGLARAGRAADDDALAAHHLEIDVLSTWKSPYHLCTSIISTAAWLPAGFGVSLLIDVFLPTRGAPRTANSGTCRSRTRNRPCRRRRSRYRASPARPSSDR